MYMDLYVFICLFTSFLYQMDRSIYHQEDSDIDIDIVRLSFLRRVQYGPCSKGMVCIDHLMMKEYGYYRNAYLAPISYLPFLHIDRIPGFQLVLDHLGKKNVCIYIYIFFMYIYIHIKL